MRFVLPLHWTGDLLELPPADEPLRPSPVDLSKAMRLKDIGFRPGSNSEWVAATLETVPPQNRDLRHISVQVPDVWSCVIHEDGNTVERVVETDYGSKWLDLDRLLVRFWESRSICPKIVHLLTGDKKTEMRDRSGHLFPELMRRGIVDLVGVDDLDGYSSEYW